MMDPIKTSRNVEFDVIYEDGDRYHVREGVLFEAVGNSMNVHLGTGRPEVLFAVAEVLTEMIDDLGLGEAFRAYIEDVCGEAQE